ncbi:MAG: L-rhamnose/proton symporter RhaT [Sedimentisphaerales bacterium]|nr:L-rhamnose/proton symporter RhaT [Sedimentisphaerales bacterium]
MIGLGVFLHAVGGFAAGSFYMPFKKIRDWAWESAWLVNGVFSWILMPWLIALLTVPNLLSVLGQSKGSDIAYCYLFGVLWGIGGLTFGLSMRYLGMSLGYAIALGFCAAFGTILPPIYDGTFGDLLATTSGLTTLAGVAVCLAGIAVCGWAGVAKEKELPTEQKQQTIKEFHFGKGLLVAVFAGIMSACMAFAIQAGEPIAELALKQQTPPLWQNSPIFIVILAGGFTTNFLWCVYLNFKNRSGRDYIDRRRSSFASNYLFSALAGITWYFQFMFYGMGKTKMGDYDFASWSIHMAFIIFFSNVWGLVFHEWKGCSRRTLRIIITGILIVLLSIALIGYGSYLKTGEKEETIPIAKQSI